MPIRITLEAALKRADMSARELARRVGAHRDTIGKYRHNAVRMISLDLVESFCCALGCSLGDVLTDQPATAQPSPAIPLPTTTTAPQARPQPAVNGHPAAARLSLPDGRVSRLPLAEMSEQAFDTWLDAWVSAYDAARKDRV